VFFSGMTSFTPKIKCLRLLSAGNRFSLILSAMQLERAKPQLASMTFDEAQDS
jgi:hypothetical protein